MQNIMGFQPVFWTGVVEDRLDPLKLGRVRVRIAGLHSAKLIEEDSTGEGIPVESLPWASAGMPCNNASMNGVGDSPVGPVEGTWLCGISRDGRTCQNLIYLWTLPGIPQSAPVNEGFNDTEKTLKVKDRPKRPFDITEKYPKTAYLKESDVNRLARGEKINETIIQTKRNDEDKSVHIANGGTWDEKPTEYAAVYPFNKVSETESGHITERDDTPGAERTHDYHRSGTFEEVYPDGSKVTKVVKDNYEIVYGNDYVHVKGNVNVSVDGNANIYVKGNVEQEVDGNHNELVKGSYSVESMGNMKFKAPRIDMN